MYQFSKRALIHPSEDRNYMQKCIAKKNISLRSFKVTMEK